MGADEYPTPGVLALLADLREVSGERDAALARYEQALHVIADLRRQLADLSLAHGDLHTEVDRLRNLPVHDLAA
jgi:hypothetical protein